LKDAPREYADIDACADAFAESGAKLAVICGTDDAYSDMAEELAEALKQAGAAKSGSPASRPHHRRRPFHPHAQPLA
jgi:methylmalonyl-CoA mutase